MGENLHKPGILKSSCSAKEELYQLEKSLLYPLEDSQFEKFQLQQAFLLYQLPRSSLTKNLMSWQ